MDPADYAHIPKDEFQELCRKSFLEAERQKQIELDGSGLLQRYKPAMAILEQQFQDWLKKERIKPFPLFPGLKKEERGFLYYMIKPGMRKREGLLEDNW